MKENDDLLRRVRLDQQRRGNLPNSIDKRTACLRAFARWLGEASLLDADKETVEKFLDSRQIGSNTRYAWISHLHCFYAWAVGEELTDRDPTLKIMRPRIRRHLPRPAATDQLTEALRLADPQFRCWLTLAALQGLRVQEIAGLERRDVLDDEGRLHVVHGKGRKERMLSLHSETLAALQELPMPTVGWVFRRPRGGPFTPAQLSQSFNRKLIDHGVDATAHQLRHWFGTNLLRGTHDLRVVQEAMGHSSPQTTAIYTAFDNEAQDAGIQSLNLGGPLDLGGVA